jgi:predicted phosphodiesterase
MSRVLVVPDLHEPVTHPAALPFCQDLQEQWQCDQVVFIGDIIDWHGISFHARHPAAPGVKEEYQLAREKVTRWVQAFPVAKVCIGNHDERPQRLAASVNIPEDFLVSYNTMWDCPNWEWAHDHVIDDVYYFHGTGRSGLYPAANVMRRQGMSVVMGHCHSRANVVSMVNPFKRFFAVDTGCLVDDRAFAFAYGKHATERSVLSAAVIIDGQPYLEYLRCGPGEPYHRSKFARTRKEKAWAKRIATYS